MFVVVFVFGFIGVIKWSGLYFLIGFVVYLVIIDVFVCCKFGVVFWLVGIVFK